MKRTTPSTYALMRLSTRKTLSLGCTTGASLQDPFHRVCPVRRSARRAAGMTASQPMPLQSATTRYLPPTLVNEMHVGMVHADKFQRSIYEETTFGIPAQYGIGGVPQVPENEWHSSSITINGLTHIGVGNFHSYDSNCLP